MRIRSTYKGIGFMLLAAAGFSTMAGAVKSLKNDLTVGQLTFFRNAIGLLVLLFGFYWRPPQNHGGGKAGWLFFRGIMGTTALYTLFFCIVHLPLGTAMTYNLSSTLFIAIFSFLLFREYHGRLVLLAVLLGFAGMIMVYKPNMHFSWVYHVAGLLSGITSAVAYITVGKLTRHYDARIIVLAFVLGGCLVPLLSMLLHYGFHLPADGVFVTGWQWPQGRQWYAVVLMGLAALFGQYCVTRAYGAEKAGIVSVMGYANIVFSVAIGVMMGDAFPDGLSVTGIVCIIFSGALISFSKHQSAL